MVIETIEYLKTNWLDIKEFGAIKERWRCVGDLIAKHIQGGDLAMSFGRVPDGFNQGLFHAQVDLNAVSSTKDIG